MATAYVVLRERPAGVVEKNEGGSVVYVEANRVTANNAEQACRSVADQMSDSDLAESVTLVAVPARNWASGRNTFAAKTERKLIRS